MTTMRAPLHTLARRTLAAGVFVALAATTALAAPALATTGPSAAAATALPAADNDVITWSVKPEPTRDEPVRTSYSYDLKKGQVIEDTLEVRNYNKTPLELDVYASDGFNSPDGTLDLLKADEKPTDIGTWVTIKTTRLKIPALASVDVPFTVRVPSETEPGDHIGGIVTSFVSTTKSQGTSPVQLDRRLGTRLLVRVDGPLNPQLAITNMKTSYDGTLNPAGSGTMTATYTVTNNGNVRMAADQAIKVSSPLGFPSRQLRLDRTAELYPGNSLTLTQVIANVWPTVRSSTKLTLVPQPTREGDTFGTDLATSASAGTWTIPWTLLLLLAVGALTMKLRQRARGLGELPAPQHLVAAGQVAP